MNKTQHISNNGVLGAPPGVSLDECTALPVTRALSPDGVLHTMSYWKPTQDELSLLKAGRPVRLVVIGEIHPMVNLGVDGDGLFEIKQQTGNPGDSDG